MIPDNEATFNDIVMLKQSETELVEARMLGEYNLQQSYDSNVLNILTEDMSSVISNTVEKISGTGVKFCDNIETYLTNSVKFIEKNKKHFESLDNSLVDFYIEGYHYSVLDSPRIDFSELDRVLDGYDQFITDINKLLQDEDMIALSVMDQLELYLSESNLSKIRASMLGCPKKTIPVEDFISELKRYYKSNMRVKEPIHVTKSYIIKDIDNLDRIKKDIEQTKKELKSLDKLCNNATKLLDLTLKSISGSKNETLRVITNLSKKPLQSTNGVYICIAIINAKYSQIVTLRSMAETILKERLTALRDQITQITETINICLYDSSRKKMGDALNIDTPNIKVITGLSNKPSKVYPITVMDHTNYLEAVLNQVILCEMEYQSIIETRYIQEMKFIQECMENQCIIPVTEAGELSKRYQSIKAAILKLIDRIIASIKSAVARYNLRYIPWISDLNEEEVKQKAQKMESIKIAPYYEVTDVKRDMNLIITEMKKGASSTNTNSLEFTRAFVSNVDTQDKYDNAKADIPGYLKNYFRFHKKDAKNVEKVEVSGKDLASKISIMISYIKNYENNTKELTKLSKAVEDSMKIMDHKVMESFQYLQLLNRPASETDLILLEGYQTLLEADDQKDKTGTVTNDKGEIESPTSVETSEQKQANENKGTSQSTKYSNTFQNFFQYVIAAYTTAMEERFINYVNTLTEISGVRPVVDKNGKYIPSDKRNNKKESTTESVLSDRLYNKPCDMKGISLYS